MKLKTKVDGSESVVVEKPELAILRKAARLCCQMDKHQVSIRAAEIAEQLQLLLNDLEPVATGD